MKETFLDLCSLQNNSTRVGLEADRSLDLLGRQKTTRFSFLHQMSFFMLLPGEEASGLNSKEVWT